MVRRDRSRKIFLDGLAIVQKILYIKKVAIQRRAKPTMNKPQELLDLAKKSYSDSVIEIVKGLHSQGLWRVLLSFGSYEDSWSSVLFTDKSTALQFKNCEESSYDELIEAHEDQLVYIPSGVSGQVHDTINALFDNRTVVN